MTDSPALPRSDTTSASPQQKAPKLGRSRSPTTKSFNDGLRNLRSLSPPTVVRRSLSPITSTMSASLDTLTKIGTSVSHSKLKHHSSSLSEVCHLDDDIAKPTRMAKSFVSLLTTASLYNGNLQNIIEDEDHNDNEQRSELESTISSETTVSEIKPLSRVSTLFQLSTEEKVAAPNSEDAGLDTKTKVLALSDKIKKAFQISEDDIFLADYSCWLMKDVVLQGHMYISNTHVLFLAFLPKTGKDEVALSGVLAMEPLIPSPKLTRYWAVLRKNTLSLYNSSSELYFPVLTIDLKTALRAEVASETIHLPGHNSSGRWIKILTETKSYKLFTDSEHSARSWVGLLKKHIFTSRNDGDCVTVKIPLHNITDIEETPIFDAADTLRLRVLESSSSYAIDDYFFMFFSSGPEVVKVLTAAVDMADTPDSTSSYDIVDSTASLSLQPKRTKSLKSVFMNRSRSSSSNSNTSKSIPEEEHLDKVEESVIEQYISRDTEESREPPAEINTTSTGVSPSTSDLSPVETTRPDLISLIPGIGTASKSLAQAKSTLGKWTPRVLKSAPNMWASTPVHYAEKNSLERGSEDEYLASPDERKEITQRFQTHFSLSKSDLLVATYYAHLQRNVPTYGKIYLGSNEICFRSLVPGFSTKMILPYKDIENCYKEKGFKFGYSGLVIVIHGHEELFFEFSSSVSRDDCEFLLLKQLDKVSASIDSSSSQSSEQSPNTKIEAAKIKLFEDKIHTQAGVNVPIIFEDHPLVGTSIKPSKSYKISLLTIGSRGDVQPYIALGKGLTKEGHEVTIITHHEFREWIESHGLKFKEIAGNPTELMSLMVSHGSMNVGLIKEASSKFRGWITELLDTSWEACQGTEILIESPSAMAGLHIAEALNIPYFRAFTMPWTRTRAYPHAFIVPEQKQGGSYNYLTHVLFENIFWKGISGQVNKWRKEKLNLPKTSLDLLQQSKVPFLYSVSPTVMAPPVDYSDWVKVTGYWFLDESITYNPPKELVDFIKKAKDDGKKLVYIGFGSIVVTNPKELTEAVVEAVLQADVRCILNKGWSERLGGPSKVEIQLPYQVFNAGALPHDWLFPQIDAAVHHGGSGTTGATLRAGLPTIIKPFFADQFFYAGRVEDIGAGIALKKLNVKSLSKALKEATTNQRMIQKAKAIGEKINKENGVDTAIETIYRELDYARGLIKNKRKIQITSEEEKKIEESDSQPILDQDDNLPTGIARDEDYDDEWDENNNEGGNNDGSWFLV